MRTIPLVLVLALVGACASSGGDPRPPRARDPQQSSSGGGAGFFSTWEHYCETHTSTASHWFRWNGLGIIGWHKCRQLPESEESSE